MIVVRVAVNVAERFQGEAEVHTTTVMRRGYLSILSVAALA